MIKFSGAIVFFKVKISETKRFVFFYRRPVKLILNVAKTCFETNIRSIVSDIAVHLSEKYSYIFQHVSQSNCIVGRQFSILFPLLPVTISVNTVG